MYKHYGRTDPNDLDNNGNPRLIGAFHKGQSYWTYDADIDIVLIAQTARRQAFIHNYTDPPGQIFDSYAWNGTNAVEFIDVETARKTRNVQIDGKTKGLIAAGFVFDGKTFSLSESAQRNWLTLDALNLKFTWPVEITTIDDKAYSLTATNRDAFVQAAIDTVKGHLDSGRAIKLVVNVAATPAAAKAIKDNR